MGGRTGSAGAAGAKNGGAAGTGVPVPRVLRIAGPARARVNAVRAAAETPPPADVVRFLVRNLDCPHCSALIVADLRKLPCAADAGYNLLNRTLYVKLRGAPPADLAETVRKTVSRYEPGAAAEPASAPPGIAAGGDDPAGPAEGGEGALIVASAVLFAAGTVLFYAVPADPPAAAGLLARALLLVSYVLAGAEVMIAAAKKLRGNLFGEELLMSIASLGALLAGEWPEAAAVMIFYRVGEYFQEKAVGRSRASIKSLLDICPDRARVKTPDGFREVDAAAVRPGDVVSIRAGERIPCDGVVIRGRASIDVSNLTGESAPAAAGPGDRVYSGAVSLDGVIEARVEKASSESAAAKIVALVESASERKSRAENFITSFARLYTPAVVAAAALLAAVPPLACGAPAWVWIERALVFLVVSCPCALVISVPLAYFSGLGVASGYGVMVKGGNYLDALARAGTVFFDKTGTLTKGTFRLSRVIPAAGADENRVLAAAYAAERNSSHPIALSVKAEAEKRGVTAPEAGEVAEIAGLGLRAIAGGREILAGNARLMEREKIAFAEAPGAGTAVYVAENGVFLGAIEISDEIREDSAKAVRDLREMGITPVMLTGDRPAVAARVAAAVGIEEYRAGLFPGDKVGIVEERRGAPGAGTAVFVGDGINDAPALALADVGVAMGGIGSDAAVEAADAVVMSDEPGKLVTAIRVARKTRAIARQNIVMALAVKFLLLILGALGITGMWFAVFGDTGVMILAVANAMRMTVRKSLLERGRAAPAGPTPPPA